MPRSLQEFWRSAQRWRTLISANSNFGAAGTERLAGVLGQCRELVHLTLKCNDIGSAGAESLAGVLPQCAALAHLDLYFNQIAEAGAKSLAEVLGQCASLAHLNLGNNKIGAVNFFKASSKLQSASYLSCSLIKM
jgi:Ran GTPase-activating protein (RanGAP) involved in mRNA processing and transport